MSLEFGVVKPFLLVSSVEKLLEGASRTQFRTCCSPKVHANPSSFGLREVLLIIISIDVSTKVRWSQELTPRPHNSMTNIASATKIGVSNELHIPLWTCTLRGGGFHGSDAWLPPKLQQKTDKLIVLL